MTGKNEVCIGTVWLEISVSENGFQTQDSEQPFSFAQSDPHLVGN